jgi:protein-disulfide isomerase
MRLILFALSLLMMAAPPALARDWSKQISKTPEGGFVVGNPKARVLVVEYASFTCGHCASFHADAMKPLLAGYVRQGKVRFEQRSLVRDAADLAAAKLARCRTTGQFFPTAAALFEGQSAWLEPFTKLTEADQATVLAASESQRLVTFARLGKLDGLARAQGFTDAQFSACLADPAIEAELGAIKQRARDEGVTKTPSFFVNGTYNESIRDWASLQTALKAALSQK